MLSTVSFKKSFIVWFHRSLLDLNRAGVPLMEIVFEPDLSSGEEAASLLRELSLILTRLGVCSCKPGALRCDANISIHKPNEPLGTRSEVKNIASVRAVAKAVEFEIARHIEVIENGGKIVNETRSWDDETGTTIRMRDKEVVQVYNLVSGFEEFQFLWSIRFKFSCVFDSKGLSIHARTKSTAH